MGTTAEKINYAINATNDIAEGINNIGGNITQNTELADFREELDKIYNELPKVTGEGSSFSLEGTRKGKVVNLPEGNTSQESTKGNQLVDFSNMSVSSNVTVSFENDILTVISSTGTYKGAYYNITNLYKSNTNKILKFVYGTITASITSGDKVNLVIRKTDNTTQYVTMINSSFTNFSHTIPNDVSNISSVQLYIFSNNTNTSTENATITIDKPMLQFGTEELDYEPYTNGASPNPDYPQDIKVVTGKNKVKIRGNQLVDFSNMSVQDASYNFENDVLNIKQSTNAQSFIHKDILTILKQNVGKKLWFNCKDINLSKYSSSSTVIAQLRYQTQGSSNIYKTLYSSNKTQTSFTIPNNLTLASIRIFAANANVDGTSEVTIEEPLLYFDDNDTYEPYIEPIEKELDLISKNLFDGSYKGYTYTSSLPETLTNNCIINNSDANNVNATFLSNQYLEILTNTLELSPNTTYTLSFERIDSKGSSWRNYIYEVNDNNSYSLLQTTYKTGNIIISFTTGNTGKMAFGFALGNNSSGENIEVKNIMLLEGEYTEETIPSYEPYYNYELAGKGEYKDLFFKNEKINPNYNAELDENEWYIKGNIGKYVYNNDLTSNGTETRRNRFVTPELNIEANLSSSALAEIALSNLMTEMDNLTGLNGTTSTKKIRIELSTVFASTPEEARQLFADKNLTIYYGTETPTYEKIPNNITLYNQLEELNKYIGQGGTLVIETESEEENAQLIVKASALASFENS